MAWRTELCKDLDITNTVGTPMKVTTKLEAGGVPAHEGDGSRPHHLYDTAGFLDDISGLQLHNKLATTARARRRSSSSGAGACIPSAGAKLG